MRLLLLFFLFPFVLKAQIITGFSSRYDDDLSEWIIYTADEDEQGQLELRWKNPLRWSDWDFRFGENYGTIEMKWPDRITDWTIRMGDEVVTARMMWSGDLSQWILTDNAISLVYKSEWNHNLEYWKIRDEKHGQFESYTMWEGDIRDWIVKDITDEEVSLTMKMTMVFLAILTNMPLDR